MTKTSKPESTPLAKIEAAAEQYGLRSFDNYAQIRSVAERLRDGLCEHLDPGGKCVFLVPPQGAFGPQNFGSGAFSVSGQGFLPLEPISFGLSVKVSSSGDYMRLVVNARKEGDRIFLRVENSLHIELDLPIEKEKLEPVFVQLTDYLQSWFQNRIDHYDEGDYGGTDIGFDIQRADIAET